MNDIGIDGDEWRKQIREGKPTDTERAPEDADPRPVSDEQISDEALEEVRQHAEMYFDGVAEAGAEDFASGVLLYATALTQARTELEEVKEERAAAAAAASNANFALGNAEWELTQAPTERDALRVALRVAESCLDWCYGHFEGHYGDNVPRHISEALSTVRRALTLQQESANSSGGTP